MLKTLLFLIALGCASILMSAENQLPDSVRKVFDVKYPGAQIEKVKSEKKKDVVEYEIEFRTADGSEIEAEFSADGMLISESKEVKVAELPAAVKALIEQKYPGSKIEEANLETLATGKHYELEIETKKGKELEVSVLEDGSKILKEEKRKDEDHSDKESKK